MKSSCGTSTPDLRIIAAVSLFFLLSGSAASEAADPPKEEKKQTSSFFGMRKPKKFPSIPTLFSKPSAKPVSTELTDEEKKLVAAASKAAAQRDASPKPAVKLPSDGTFAVQPRRPIVTPVTAAPLAVVPVDPNRKYVPHVPKAPTPYLAAPAATQKKVPQGRIERP